MAYRELGIKIVQQFTGAVAAVVTPLLPEGVIGPAFNIQEKVAHSTAYDGTQATVPYPNLGVNEYVDLGTEETWGENEVAYPVQVFMSAGTKVIAAAPDGYFGSDRIASGVKQNTPTRITGFPAGSFTVGDVGKKIYIHTGDPVDVGQRTILGVNATGTEITVTPTTAWNTTGETVTVSVLPSSGNVKRFYSPGNLGSVRVGDWLQISPTYPTNFAITAVDVAGNYVEVAFEQSPTANPTGWRVVASFAEYELERGVHFSVDRNNIYVNPGVVEGTTPTGLILSATILVSYRALKTSLSGDTDFVENETDIVNKVGIIHEANPLALSLSKAIENTTTRVFFSGFDISATIKSGIGDFDRAGDYNISDVLDRIADEDLYVLSLLSQEVSHHTAFKTHIVDTSDPNGIYNRVRIGLINRSLITETSLQALVALSDWYVRGVTEIVSAPIDGQINSKDERFYSRGSIEFPDFDGSTAPRPVDPLSDLVRFSGGVVSANNGWWRLEQAEHLLVKNPATSGSAPYWGYVVGYNNRIRSCVFQLTASDSLSTPGSVRLTAPDPGAFDHITPLPPPNYACVAYMPTATDGIRGEVTAVDPVNGQWVDTDIDWDSNYGGNAASQISVTPFDDVFRTPGITATAEAYTLGAPASASPMTGTRYTAAVPGSFGYGAGNAGCKVGNTVEVTGSATPADDGYHAIIAVDPTGNWIDVANVATTLPDGGTSVVVRQTRLTGGAGLNEFVGLIGIVPAAQVSGCTFRYAGRENTLSGTTTAGNDIGFAAADLFGPKDIGRLVRIHETVSGNTYLRTITDVFSDQLIEVDGAAFGGALAVTLYLADNDYTDHTVKVFDMDTVNGSYVIVDESWSQVFAGNNLSSIVIPGVATFGHGDLQRVVSALSGAYAGQTGLVQAVRPNELALLASLYTTDDVSGFGIAFSATPGNNTFRLKARVSGVAVNDSSKVYSVERDFRYFNIVGETFTSKLQSGDIIRVTAPPELAGDYTVDSVISDERVLLETGSPFDLDALTEVFTDITPELRYELVRPNTKDEQAEAVRDYALALAERRIILIWPDICDIDISGVTVEVPGYHIGSIIGALISGLPPQQPMSRLGITGVERVPHGRVDNYFTRVQMNTIAEGGVFILEQIDITDIPFVRHQLTTDVQDVKHQEVSITKSVDYIDRIIRQEFDPYIGKYNLTDPTLSKLRSVSGAIVAFVEDQNDPNAGPLVNEMRFEELDVSEQNIDEVVTSVYLDMPIPFNNLTVTMYI